MRLLWGKNKTAIVLVAETVYEVAFVDIVVEDLKSHKYEETKKGERIVAAKWTIVPEENKE